MEKKNKIQILSKAIARITTGLLIILLGLVFVVIAHVMEDAHALSEENNQFV